MLREGDVLAERYRLRTRLGGGGMAAVWLADDIELDRPVAVKLLAADADRDRFEREARAYAACSHPNIARVYDYGEAGDRPHIVLEYVPGGTLEDRLAEEAPLPVGEATRIAGEIAAGMAHAHARGLVHRDLKPANIMFDDEQRTKIADFGIAQLPGASTLTAEGSIVGTAAYISPEQARGEPATPASDVYAFGAILFRMLTGRLPFESTSVIELLYRHANEEPPPVGRFRKDVPDHLQSLVAIALAKDPRERPQDGRALAAALSGHGGVEAVTEVLRPPRRRPSRRAAVACAAALALLLPIGFVAAVLATRTRSEAPPPARAGTVKRQQPVTAVAPEPAAPAQTSTTTTESRPTSRPAPAPPSPAPTTTSTSTPTTTTQPETTTEPETTTTTTTTPATTTTTP